MKFCVLGATGSLLYQGGKWLGLSTETPVSMSTKILLPSELTDVQLRYPCRRMTQQWKTDGMSLHDLCNPQYLHIYTEGLHLHGKPLQLNQRFFQEFDKILANKDSKKSKSTTTTNIHQYLRRMAPTLLDSIWLISKGNIGIVQPELVVPGAKTASYAEVNLQLCFLS